MKLKAAITENLGVKIVALVVALIIWFNVSGQERTVRYVTLPLKLINIPDSLTVRGSYPTEVEVQLTATKRRFLHMGFRRMYIAVNLAEAAPGRFRQILSGSNVVLPSFMDPSNIRIISPAAIDLYFERKITRKIPVMLNTTGAPPEGYLLLGKPVVEPDSVTVTGGESIVSGLKSIPTKAIDLTRLKSSYEREEELLFDERTLVCRPEKVSVRIIVSEKATRTLANVPPTLLFDARDFRAEVIPKTVSVEVEGPKALLDTLKTWDVSVLLDVGGRKPGKYSLAPEVIVPPGLRVVSIDVDTMIVDLIKVGGQEKK